MGALARGSDVGIASTGVMNGSYTKSADPGKLRNVRMQAIHLGGGALLEDIRAPLTFSSSLANQSRALSSLPLLSVNSAQNNNVPQSTVCKIGFTNHKKQVHNLRRRQQLCLNTPGTPQTQLLFSLDPGNRGYIQFLTHRTRPGGNGYELSCADPPVTAATVLHSQGPLVRN
jgi:hypothetical protein